MEGMKDCDWVFHLAAYAKPSYKDPSVVTRINVEGTVNVFEAALEVTMLERLSLPPQEVQ